MSRQPKDERRMEKNKAEYIVPKRCEDCGSENIAIRVIYDTGVTRYICLDCNKSRSLPKQENLKKRNNGTVNRWALQVIKRHPYCTICRSTDRLEAHHIIPVSHSRKYMYIPENGITLCKQCHDLVHNTDKSFENSLREEKSEEKRQRFLIYRDPLR